MSQKTLEQITFGQGLNAQAAPHLLAEGEVQLATNVDFSLEWGGLVCRRGTVLLGSAGAAPIQLVTRNYNGTQGSLDSSNWYAVGSGTSGFYRGTGTVTWTQISAGDASASTLPQGVAYENYQYLANGSVAIRDNGTNAWNWVLDQPAQIYVQPTSVAGVNNPFSIGSGTGGFNGTWTVTSTTQGTFVSAGGSPVLSTLTNGTGASLTNGIVAIATVVGSQVYTYGTGGTSTATIQNTDFNQSILELSGVLHGTTLFHPTGTATLTQSIGNYGVDYLTIGFSNPDAVVSINVDYSIFDTGFFNYWHTQTTIAELVSASPDATAQLLASQGNKSFGEIQQLLQQRIRGKVDFVGDPHGGNQRPASVVTDIPGGINAWAIPRTSYQLIGTLGAGLTGWESIKAVRISVQTTDQTSMIIGIPKTYGNNNACLNDTVNGISWFQTFARIENGVIVAESAPSIQSQQTGTAGTNTAYQGATIQYGEATINAGAYSGTSTTGVTHRVLYRQGGYLSDAYMVDAFPISQTIITDLGYPDMECIANSTMTRSLWATWPTGGVGAVSEPFQDRIFLGTGNSLFWTAPGSPTMIEADSDVTVSNQGDPIQALQVWDRLIIVNNNSVYEIDGSIWEGPNQDWSLRRTGSKRGSAAAKTCIKTPSGILLFSYDGISLYYPGYGVDTPLDWVYEKIGDLWRGTASNSPAVQKGRIPGMNLGAISQSCAVYAEQKIYLAVPTGTNTVGGDTIFVLDLPKKQVWMYQPVGYKVTALFWDYAGGRLVAGTDTGGVVQFEVGQKDLGSAIPWSVRTRAWSTKQDLVLENLGIENLPGTGVIVAKAIVDNTSTVTLGTYTGTSKQWSTTALLGTVGNNIVYEFDGTQSGSGSNQAIYQMSWDTSVQPQRVQYLRTEFDEGGQAKAEKIWDTHYTEIDIQGTGTVTAVTFIDNVAVMTNFFVGPSTISQTPFPFPYGTTTGTLQGSGPQLIPYAFPVETYGNIAYTTYTVGTFSGVTFKHYDTYNLCRPEPPRVSRYVSDRFSAKGPSVEGWWHDVLCDINPLGAPVLGTMYLDGVALTTFTATGSKRGSYNFALPVESYGNEAWVEYNSQGQFFKHYSTWYNVSEEPSRANIFESDRVDGGPQGMEGWWHDVMFQVNPLGQTVLGTVWLDGTALTTYTMTGNERLDFNFALPSETYGNVAYTRLTAASGTGVFKHYKSWFNVTAEPTRALFFESPNIPFPSESYVKTWLAEINPLGGTVTGILYIDGVGVSTQTMTGSQHHIYEYGLPNVTVGKTVRAAYTSTTPFKYWERGQSALEFEPRPFGKTTWLVTYKKLGGVTQLDLARFYAMDVEGPVGCVFTNTWIVDGGVFTVNTFTLSQSNAGEEAGNARMYNDQIPFPPGCRGYLFQQQMTSTNTFHVWRSNIDIDRVGVKGLSRVTLEGTPKNG